MQSLAQLRGQLICHVDLGARFHTHEGSLKPLPSQVKDFEAPSDDSLLPGAAHTHSSIQTAHADTPR